MRKLPKLTLRDLFWLVALVAMGCGWWVDRRSVAARAKLEINQAEQKAGQADSNSYGLTLVLEKQGYRVEKSSSGGLLIYPPGNP